MKNKNFSSLLSDSLMIVGWITLGGCAGLKTNEPESREEIAVMITGVHHLGTNFNIGEFYINNNYSSNVGRNGGGASHFCCSELPRNWRPGLIAEVRWSVNDWSKAVKAEVDAGNYKSIGFQKYFARVPIERYEKVGDLYPHFFPDGKVRLVSSNYPISNPKHPIQPNDKSAIEFATDGVKVIKDK